MAKVGPRVVTRQSIKVVPKRHINHKLPRTISAWDSFAAQLLVNGVEFNALFLPCPDSGFIHAGDLFVGDGRARTKERYYVCANGHGKTVCMCLRRCDYRRRGGPCDRTAERRPPASCLRPYASCRSDDSGSSASVARSPSRHQDNDELRACCCPVDQPGRAGAAAAGIW